MKLKFILKYTVLLLSLIFVVERSVQCFNRFLDEPQAVEIKMSDGINEIMMTLTDVKTLDCIDLRIICYFRA